MPRWLLMSLVAMVLFGAWGFVSKPVSDLVSAWQTQAFSTLGLLPVLVWLPLTVQFKKGSNRRQGFRLGFVAGMVGSAGNVACYQAMAEGGKAAAVIPLTALYPLVTILLASVVLKEKLNRIQGTGIAISVLALVLLNGGSESALVTPWLAVALIPIALWGVSALLQKVATNHASTELSTFAFLLGFVPLALVTPLLEPMKTALPVGTWSLLLGLGFVFALGNTTLIAAYANGGNAAIVTPLASLYSLVTIPLAVVFLKEKIGARESLGILLAVVAVVALAYEKPQPSPVNPLADKGI